MSEEIKKKEVSKEVKEVKRSKKKIKRCNTETKYK